MRIVARSEKGADWRVLESVGYDAERELQALLAETPSLIPIADVRVGASLLVAAAREVWMPNAGAIDVLAFSADGEVTVVECKLAVNADRRQVLAQVLDYASDLWGMSYDDLNARVRKASGSDLAPLVEEGAEPGKWNEEEFRQGVDSALKSGFFNLVIAVDAMNDQLLRMIRYLNLTGKPEFRLAGLEMERFESDMGEVLVPRIHAPQIQTPSHPGTSRWDDTRFYEDCQRHLSEGAVEIIRDLHAWGGKHFDYGYGTKIGSLNYYLWHPDKGYLWAFQVTARGKIGIKYGALVPAIGEEATRTFQEQLSKIPSFAHLPGDLMRHPELSIEASLVDAPQDIAQFKAAVEELERELHG